MLPLISLRNSDRPIGSLSSHWPAAINVIPNWLSIDKCDRLIRRWKMSHAETGHIPDGSPVGTPIQIDRQEKYRIDHFIRSGEDAVFLNKHLRKTIKEFDKKCGKIECFRIGAYRKGGHFRPHRDNATGEVSMRRWALTCVLDSKYKGGELVFPELDVSFSPTPDSAPAGTAIVFDVGLLHGVNPVVSGCRFSLISFVDKP